LACQTAKRAALLTGPEGGLTDEELAALVAAGWQPAALGPRVLRAETAALAATALLQGALGDLGTKK
ncbi:MAG TPA: RsmE family RNA methyltransferase, partial [bacterium]|nr:RsmE family RNA methyltransferase [bacterium]